MVNTDDEGAGEDKMKKLEDMIAQLSLTIANQAEQSKQLSLTVANQAEQSKQLSLTVATQAEQSKRLEGKLNQAIAVINKRTANEPGEPGEQISGTGGLLDPNHRDKGPGPTKNQLPAAAGGNVVDDGSDNGNLNATNSTASSRSSKEKKKKKKAKSDSDDDNETVDVYNTTGFIYDADSEEEDNAGGRKASFKVEIKEFNFGEEGADWTSWVKKFQASVKGACNPRNAKEHHKYNLRFLPMRLNTTAHDIFLNCRHKDDWPKVAKELEEAFDDPAVKQRWRTDLRAYTWDEKQPLHVYRGNVIRYVNKYDSELRTCPEARKKAYYGRFVGGMPEDYVNFIEQQLYDDKQTIDRALQVSQQFQITKQRTSKSDTKKEVAGHVSFHGNERLATVEQEIAKLNTKTNTLDNKIKSGAGWNTSDAGKTPPAFPRQRSNDRYNSNDRHNSNNRYNSNNRQNDYNRGRSGQSPGRQNNDNRGYGQSDRRSGDRFGNGQGNKGSYQERLDRFKSKNYGFPATANNDPQKQEHKGSGNMYSRFIRNRDGSRGNRSSNDLDQTLAQASEPEQEDDDTELDNTTAEYFAYREQVEAEELAQFAADKAAARDQGN